MILLFIVVEFNLFVYFLFSFRKVKMADKKESPVISRKRPAEEQITKEDVPGLVAEEKTGKKVFSLEQTDYDTG